MRATLPLKSWMIPFLLVLGGVLSDYLTTTLGQNMSMGLREINPQYDPLWALLVFWGAISILMLTLPKERPWHLAANGLALASYLGAANNTLVILGLLSGLAI